METLQLMGASEATGWLFNGQSRRNVLPCLDAEKLKGKRMLNQRLLKMVNEQASNTMVVDDNRKVVSLFRKVWSTLKYSGSTHRACLPAC